MLVRLTPIIALSQSHLTFCQILPKCKILQDKMESILFSIMSSRGFGEEYIERYKMVSRFFQQRRPLIVLICGSPFTGLPRLKKKILLIYPSVQNGIRA